MSEKNIALAGRDEIAENQVPVRLQLWRYLAVVGSVAATSAFYYRLLHVNPTTVALTFLLLIVSTAARWGLRYAVVLSLLSGTAFNYFFLPPLLTFTITSTENWIALLAFLATGLGASQLAERARREAQRANRRRQEIELLYALSQRLMLSDNALTLVETIPSIVAETVDAEGAAVVLAGDSQIYRSYPGFAQESDAALFALANAEDGALTPELDSSFRSAFLRLGLRRFGVMVVRRTRLSPEMLDAAGSLIAISIERARSAERLSRSEAARQSEELRNALLDSVTHEVRTPLTSILAAVSGLKGDAGLDTEQREELLSVVEEESLRLNRLIGDAVEMSALETNQIGLDLQPERIETAIELALERARSLITEHPLQLAVAADLPPVRMDLTRIVTVLQCLLENAAKYSLTEAPICVACVRESERVMRASVRDRGPGIPEEERLLIFEKFYRGRQTRHVTHGTGMGLAIAKAIVEAHGGTLSLVSRVGEGSTFSFDLTFA